jgi:hypothetical protein
MALKLAAIVLAMWKKEERHDPRKIHPFTTG